MAILDHYWSLASENHVERLNAAEALINELIEKDSQQDWEYALNRLLRGLSSARGSARLGFSVALSEVLITRKDHIDLNEYLDKTSQLFQVSASVKGPEERGLLFGKLFALKTLAKSPLWTKETSGSFERFIDLIFEVGLGKAWLREPAFHLLSEVSQLVQAGKYNLDKTNALTYIYTKILENGLALTCEGVALSLVLGPEDREKYFEKSAWKSGNPLARGNFPELVRVLRDLPLSGTEVQKINNNRNALHFVWSLLLEEFISVPLNEEQQPAKKHKSSSGKKSKRKSDIISLAEFWKTVVDEGFFTATASPERKLSGFNLLMEWLPIVNEPETLFTSNLIRTLSNQLANKDRLLNKAAKKVYTVILDVSKQRHVAAKVLHRILEENPNINYTSKSKLVTELISCVDEDAVILVKDLLHSFSVSDTITDKRNALDTLVHFVKTRKAESDKEWLNLVIEGLVPTAYMNIDTVSEELASLAQERLMSILSSSMGSPVQFKASYPYRTLKQVQRLQESGSQPRVEFDADIAKAKQRAEATVDMINRKRLSSPHTDSVQLQAFELLFSIVLLQLYGSNTEAVTILDEVQMCYTNICTRDQDAGQEVDVSQVLAEVLISFLSQQSLLLRKLSENVFASFTKHVTQDALQLFYNVLQTHENEYGQNALFEIEDNETEESDSEMEDEQENEQEDEDSSESDVDEDDSEGDDVVDKETETALAATLGVTAESRSESEDEEDIMNDEQMAALDGQLANIFRQRQEKLANNRSKAKKAQAAKQNVAMLKLRVLDLLDIYLTKEPSSHLGLEMAIELLEALKLTKDPLVMNKARDLLRTRLCRRMTIELEGADVEKCIELLNKVHEIASTSQSKVLSLACNQGALFYVRLVLNYDSKNVEVIANVYQKSMIEWFQKKNKTTSGMFMDFINYLSSKRG